jgi:protein subunit release factor B
MPPIPENELEFTFFRSSGPGGQKKNTTDSSVRLRHLPTGIVVIATESRSQLRNKQAALIELERRIERRNRRRKPRVPTKPSKAAKQKRITHKRIRSSQKQLRQKPDVED